MELYKNCLKFLKTRVELDLALFKDDIWIPLMSKRNFINDAKEVINLEIKALQKLKKIINNSFNKAVIHIAKCQSKVILCGVGKSGLIASKIAATLSSVGTPSFSLSAGDSSHGDLGSISKKDILILISNSGETNELRNIIQFANRNKILLIGIVSKKIHYFIKQLILSC